MVEEVAVYGCSRTREANNRRLNNLHPHAESQTVTSYFSSHSAILPAGSSDMTAAPAHAPNASIVVALSARQPRHSSPSRE